MVRRGRGATGKAIERSGLDTRRHRPKSSGPACEWRKSGRTTICVTNSSGAESAAIRASSDLNRRAKEGGSEGKRRRSEKFSQQGTQGGGNKRMRGPVLKRKGPLDRILREKNSIC